MTTTTPVDLEAYRREARAWIAANLAPREIGQDPVAANLRGSREYTREQMAAERPKQRALFDAGYAGITWPVEYGGQGLTRAHERAFLEEAAGFELPDFGYAGSMTFGVCAAVILAHASEDFKRRHLPRMLKGEELWVQFFSEPSGDACDSRRRYMDPQRRQSMDLVRPPGRLGSVSCPLELERSEASRAHVVRGTGRRAGCHRAGDPSHQRRCRFLRRILR